MSLFPGEGMVIHIGLQSKKANITLDKLAHIFHVNAHRLDLGFVITFHKAQGKTLPRIILQLNKRPFRPGITFNMLFGGPFAGGPPRPHSNYGPHQPKERSRVPARIAA